MTHTKKRIRTIAVLVVLTLLFSAFAAAAFSLPRRAGAAEGVWETGTFEEVYNYGTVLNVPSATVEAGGKSAAAKAVVSFPGGKTLSTEKVTLDETGKYTVEYKAVIDGELYTCFRTFSVTNSLYTLTSPASSASYGAPTPLAARDGLMVRLSSGAKLLVNKTIDLNGITESDTLISVYINPEKAGYNDFMRLCLVFTDVEDSENFMQFRIRTSEESTTYIYGQVGGKGQITTGYESGVHDTLHRGGIYGTVGVNSFFGSFQPVENDLIRIKYNDMTKCAYLHDSLIADMDNPAYFTTLWDGFTDGRVQLSVYAEEYIGSYANFVIDTLYGVDLSETMLTDKEAPVINIDNSAFPNGFPDALVGAAYKVPEAAAKDLQDGECEVSRRVFLNYENPSMRTEVAVVDGRFTPSAAADYTIVYSAEDSSGNKATPFIWTVTAKTSLPALTLTVETEGRKTAASVGERVAISGYSASGGVGDNEFDVKVTAPDGSVAALANGIFFLEAQGAYKVAYSLRDFAGQIKTESYTVTASYNPFAVFTEDAELPEVFLAGYTYEIPKLNSYIYSASGKTAVETQCTVTMDGVEKQLEDGKIKVVTSRASGGILTVKYVSTEGGKSVTYSRNIVPTNFDSGNGLRIKPENYFSTNLNANKELSQEGLRIYTAADRQNGFGFVRNILSESFALAFSAEPAAANFRSLDFYFTDSVDESVVVKVSFVNNGINKASVVINNGNPLSVDASFKSESQTDFKVGVSGDVITAGNLSLATSKTLSGEPFKGFPSNYMKMRAEFGGVTGSSAIKIVRFNNQPINNVLTTDGIRPQIVFVGEYGGTAEMNSVYSTPAAYAYDAFSPNVDFRLTVSKPGGAIAKDITGRELKNVPGGEVYKIRMDTYGYYSFMYTAKDESGNEQERSFNINVPCRNAPELKLKKSVATEGKVGKAVNLPSATAVSERGFSVKIAVFVVTPQGIITRIADGDKSFIPAVKGVYTVRYMMIELSETGDAENVSIKNFAVTVK